MKLNITLSGIALDLAGKEIIPIELNDPETLLKTISTTVPGLENYFLLISINGKFTENYSSLKPGDNVLVFSPIAGG